MFRTTSPARSRATGVFLNQAQRAARNSCINVPPRMRRIARPWAMMLSIATLAVCLWTQSAYAESENRALSGLAVQNRQYMQGHELTFAVGSLPLDAFTKGLTLGGGYTWHINDLVAWEVIHAGYSFGIDTSLKSDLLNFDVRPSAFEVVHTYAMSNIVFKPVYWKAAALNRGLSRGELMFTLGGGYGWLTASNRVALSAGTAVRLYANEFMSVRLDVRYMGFAASTSLDDVLGTFDLHNELWIGLGGSLGI